MKITQTDIATVYEIMTPEDVELYKRLTTEVTLKPNRKDWGGNLNSRSILNDVPTPAPEVVKSCGTCDLYNARPCRNGCGYGLPMWRPRTDKPKTPAEPKKRWFVPEDRTSAYRTIEGDSTRLFFPYGESHTDKTPNDVLAWVKNGIWREVTEAEAKARIK